MKRYEKCQKNGSKDAGKKVILDASSPIGLVDEVA